MLESFSVLGFEVQLAFAYQYGFNNTLQYSNQTLWKDEDLSLGLLICLFSMYVMEVRGG